MSYLFFNLLPARHISNAISDIQQSTRNLFSGNNEALCQIKSFLLRCAHTNAIVIRYNIILYAACGRKPFTSHGFFTVLLHFLYRLNFIYKHMEWPHVLATIINRQCEHTLYYLKTTQRFSVEDFILYKRISNRVFLRPLIECMLLKLYQSNWLSFFYQNGFSNQAMFHNLSYGHEKKSRSAMDEFE